MRKRGVESVENYEIADLLDELADLLEIGGANPFRVRAYRNAARTVREHATPMRRLVGEDADLTEIPTIGEDMEKYITEIVTTGRFSRLEETAEEVPRSLAEITRIQGVGPKRTAKLWKELGIETLDALEEAARAGRVTELEGFGEKTQQKILEGIEGHRRRTERFLLADADRFVEPLLAHMEEAPGVERLEVAGSYRRRVETVGDIDLLAVAAEGEAVMEHFTGYRRVAAVEQAGETRGTVVLDSGLQVDLRIVERDSYGAALVYFTGSKEHNVKLRKRALSRDLTISEYGVFELEEEPDDAARADDASGEDRHRGRPVAGATEEEVYAAVELPWIPPELREDRGEIEAAAEDRLPELLEAGDLRGDLQMHTTWSDGRNSVEEMLVACRERGYEYFAVTDHSRALAMAGGLDEDELREQWEEMEEVAARHDDIQLLRSVEVDILEDGSLDLSDEVLAGLDLVVASIHSRFDLPAAEQTERIVRAIRHPSVDILAHPTGRRIGSRDPYELDMEAVLRAAKEEGVAVELNAHPDRLDLKDTHLIRARELGVTVVISTDAHRTAELALMRYGVEQARRAWLTAEHVLNTRPLDELLGWLGRG